MNIEEENKHYSPNGLDGLAEVNARLKSVRDKIKYRLELYKKASETAWNEKRVVLEYIQDEKVGPPEKAELSVELSEFIERADTLSRIAEDLREGHESFITRKNNDERRTRAAERKDKWLLWRDQLVRWILGTCLAIVIYSAFVYASDEHCVKDDGKTPRWCIKIPVKDWFDLNSGAE